MGARIAIEQLTQMFGSKMFNIWISSSILTNVHNLKKSSFATHYNLAFSHEKKNLMTQQIFIDKTRVQCINFGLFVVRAMHIMQIFSYS